MPDVRRLQLGVVTVKNLLILGVVPPVHGLLLELLALQPHPGVVHIPEVDINIRVGVTETHRATANTSTSRLKGEGKLSDSDDHIYRLTFWIKRYLRLSCSKCKS